MKKEIPSWMFATVVVVVVGIGGLFLARAIMGPGELPAPKIKVKTEIPEHLKGKVSPETEAMIREQTRKYGEIDPNAPSAPTGPPNAPR